MNLSDRVQRENRRLLRPDGKAILLVPHGIGVHGSLDRMLRHCRRYSQTQLGTVTQKAGFRCVSLVGFNRSGSLAWWIDGRVLQRGHFSVPQIKLLDWLVPVFRRMDRFTLLLSLTLLAILEPALPEADDLQH